MEHYSRPEEGVELKAPEGKFRVVAVCTFGRAEWVKDDFKTLEEAIACTKKDKNPEEKRRTKMHI